MNYKKYIILLLIPISLISCHSIKVNHATMHTASTMPMALGVIGMQHNKMMRSDFKETAIPTYKEAIRVGVNTTTFNLNTYKAYTQHSKNNKQGVTYVDSLKTKPSFLQLEITDRVTLLSELKKEENQATLVYLKNQENTGMVTGVSIALPESLIIEISNAEAVFLINEKYKQYQLSLVRDGKLYKTIDFSSATVFGYRLSHFCWGISGKRKVVLSDIIDEKASCPNNTYKNAEKAKEKMDYFKL